MVSFVTLDNSSDLPKVRNVLMKSMLWSCNNVIATNLTLSKANELVESIIKENSYKIYSDLIPDHVLSSLPEPVQQMVFALIENGKAKPESELKGKAWDSKGYDSP